MATLKEKIRQEMEERRQLKHTSPLEAWVVRWLNDCGIYEFERECAIGPYLADLFFPKLQLVIELDGRQFHEGRGAKDAAKDAYIRSQGLHVERWCSTECWNPRNLAVKIAGIHEKLNPGRPTPAILVELGIHDRPKRRTATYDQVLGSWVNDAGVLIDEEDLAQYDVI